VDALNRLVFPSLTKGKHAAMVLFSFCPEGPRPLRAAEGLVSAYFRLQKLPNA